MDDVASALVRRGYAEMTTEPPVPPTKSVLYQNSVKKLKEIATDTYKPVNGSAVDISSYLPPSPPPNDHSYLPPSPPPNDHFVLSVTYVSEGGVIHGHILEEGNSLTALLGVNYLTPPPPRYAVVSGDGSSPKNVSLSLSSSFNRLTRPGPGVLCLLYRGWLVVQGSH